MGAAVVEVPLELSQRYDELAMRFGWRPQIINDRGR